MSDEPRLLTLPPEIVLQVLSNLDPIDASRFFETCKDANAFACSFTLNKQLFLNLFDPPPSAPEGEVFPFAERLRARVRARGWLSNIEKLVDSGELESTLETLVDIAESRSASSTYCSRNQQFLDSHVNDEAVDELSQRRKGGHALRKAHSGRAPSSRAVQLSAHLHALHSPTPHAAGSPFVRTAAREVVYAQSEWLRSSNWGPFVTGTGGRKSVKGLVVDWHKLTALAVVMATNLRELEGTGWGGDDVEIPKGWDSTRPGEVPEGRDWAGVEDQNFRGTYAFLDYRSFEHYNFHRSNNFTPSLEDESEAVGDCMQLTLKLVDEPSSLLLAIDDADADSSLGDSDNEDDASFRTRSSSPSPAPSDSGSDTSQVLEPISEIIDVDAPSPPTSEVSSKSAEPAEVANDVISDTSAPLSFSGTSERLAFDGVFATNGPGAMPQRTIHGTVSRTPEGHVHWTFVICYNTGPQWLMHGIQIGGVRSKYGIVGTWSTADHDAAGPNGPFWYWPQQAA